MVCKIIKKKSIFLFKKYCKKYGFTSDNILPHSSYLINLGHPDIIIRKKSIFSLIKEIEICNLLDLSKINFHPGSHLRKITEKECLKNVIDSINYILDKTVNVSLVIENTSGQGSNIGYCFEHIAYIIKNVLNKSRIGVCIDSCHLFSSGYDVNSFLSFINTFKIFNEIVGIEYLKGIHLNDSKKSLGSKLDRHHNLGKGKIKKEFFMWMMQVKQFNKIPIILETKDSSLWKEEIEWLKNIQFKKIEIDLL